nr:MFS transporter [Streptomyces tsukubensis]
MDLAPLRDSADFRRLWAGNTVSWIGQAMTALAVSLQVYDITRSSFSVGLVGLFSFVPLMIFGLYGGAIADIVDRRRLGLISSLGSCALSVALSAAAFAGFDRVWFLYAIVALQAVCGAVNSPARSAMIPRLVPPEQLQAANALTSMTITSGTLMGPMLGGLVVGVGGYQSAYLIDAVAFSFSLYAMWRLPAMLPGRTGDGPVAGHGGDGTVAGQGGDGTVAGQGGDGTVRGSGRDRTVKERGGDGAPPDRGEDGAQAGQASVASGARARRPSVVDGLRFLASRPNLRTAFVSDLCAMVLAHPRALYPAVAVLWYGGDAKTTGLLVAAPACGAMLGAVFSGWQGRVRGHGAVILIAVAAWGAAIAVFGLTRELWLGLLFLALAGCADMVSMAFRNTMLQAASPDEMRGRLQGVFIVVVAGGPRLGEFLAGSVADLTSPGFAITGGGVACVVAVSLMALKWRGFARYDARNPRP